MSIMYNSEDLGVVTQVVYLYYTNHFQFAVVRNSDLILSVVDIEPSKVGQFVNA